MLTLLGDILHSLSHQGNEHVEEENKGEDDIGDEQEKKQDGVLGVLLDVQVTQADGELEEFQHRITEAAVGTAALTVLGTLLDQRGQGWEDMTGRSPQSLCLGNRLQAHTHLHAPTHPHTPCRPATPSLWPYKFHLQLQLLQKPHRPGAWPQPPVESPSHPCLTKPILFSPSSTPPLSL